MIEFQTLDGPQTHVFVGGESAFCDAIWKLAKDLPSYQLKVLQGPRMRTEDALFQEFAAAFQFPYYFGNNWPALGECLADLEWLQADGYVLFLSNAPMILSEGRTPINVFIRIVSNIAKEWASRDPLGDAFGRRAKPFHLVFNCAPDHEALLQSNLAYLVPSRTLLR